MSNKLIKGDSTMEMLEINDKSVDCIITDPPYGVNFKAHYDDSKEYVFGNVSKWFDEFKRITKIGSHIFVFVPVLEIHKWIEAGIGSGLSFKNIISTKAHFIGKTFRQKNSFSYEFQPILHFTNGKGKPFNEYDFIPTSNSWFNDKRNANPKQFTYIYPNYLDKNLVMANTKSVRGNSTLTDRHPNEKNVELIDFLIGISTNEGDTVLDPFMGGGTTGISAIKNNRKFIGIELDEKFYNLSHKKLKGE